MALAEKSRVLLGEWFLTPLHPVKGDLSAWGYEYGKYPVAEYLAEHVVNLPTTPSDVGRVVRFLEENMNEIVDSDSLFERHSLCGSGVTRATLARYARTMKDG